MVVWCQHIFSEGEDSWVVFETLDDWHIYCTLSSNIQLRDPPYQTNVQLCEESAPEVVILYFEKLRTVDWENRAAGVPIGYIMLYPPLLDDKYEKQCRPFIECTQPYEI
jgi:hypothetical protein